MDDSDTPRFADIPAALGLLSRLPVPVDRRHATRRGARAAWAWPVAGAILGALAGLVGALALMLGLPPAIAAGLALAVLAVVTGALHEDGLADCADGFWGGWSVSARLEIMKDSRIGTYGTLALVFATGIRWSALTTICAAGPGAPIAAMIGVGAVSRLFMVALMHGLPNARPGGLSARVGRPGRGTLLVALLATLVVAIPALGGATIAVLGAGGVVTLALARLARARIGGQTGDVLGAAQVLCDLAALTVLAALAH